MIAYSRLPFVVLALLCLVIGLLTGLSRVGWEIFVVPATAHHGAIMVGGFLGTLIAIEKLIPLKKKVLFVIPMLSGGSMILFLVNMPGIAMAMLIVASFSLSCIFAYYFNRHRDLSYPLMLAGSLCWLLGNFLLYTNKFYPHAFPWWLGFILCIIVGERLEITKFLPVTKNQKGIILFFLGFYLTGASLSFHGLGNILSGAALVGTSVWLLRFDVIGMNIARNGLVRYVAVALLCGYAAMLLCGVFFIVMKGSMFGYDALVHTFFLGFAFSMIFAHGPIILPGVIGIFVKPYHFILYGWLALLQVSWIVRVIADIGVHTGLRRYCGMASALAIVGYFLSLVTVAIGSNLKQKTN